MTGAVKHTNLRKYRQNEIVQFLGTGWMDWFSHRVFGKESLPLEEWKKIPYVRQTQWFIIGPNVG